MDGTHDFFLSSRKWQRFRDFADVEFQISDFELIGREIVLGQLDLIRCMSLKERSVPSLK